MDKMIQFFLDEMDNSDAYGNGLRYSYQRSLRNSYKGQRGLKNPSL